MYIFVLLVRRHAQALLQVGASTEGIIALARDDQCSCAALAVLLVQALDDTVQLAEQLLRNSIAGLGTVKRQHGDGARVWSRDARDLEGSAQGRGVAALVVDGGLQPLSVGGDDAAAGEEAEHDCCMVGASNRERLARTRRGGCWRINAMLGPRPRARFVTCANGTISTWRVS